MDTTTAKGIDQVMAAHTRLGRKFEDTDMTREFCVIATQYALNYRGDFDWLRKQTPYARKGVLNESRARGVLNCMVADVRHDAAVQARQQAKTEASALPTVDVRAIPNGRFRMVLDDGATLVLRLEDATWANDKPKGTRSASIRNGTRWSFAGFADTEGRLEISWRVAAEHDLLTRSLDVLRDGTRDGSWIVWALNYSQDCGECSFCGLELDDPRSLRVGYGPTCAKLRDLPWGEKAEPMAVVLAKAGLGKAPAPAREVRAERQLAAAI